jgi:hypothetical protein
VVKLPAQPSEPKRVRAEALSAAIFPIELHPKAGKDLPDKTVREAF